MEKTWLAPKRPEKFNLAKRKGEERASSDNPIALPKGKGEGRGCSDDHLLVSKGNCKGSASNDNTLALL